MRLSAALSAVWLSLADLPDYSECHMGDARAGPGTTELTLSHFDTEKYVVS